MNHSRIASEDSFRFGRDVLILTVLFLSFALANNFPLYYPDSGGYDGHVIALTSIRTWTLSAVARPLWPLIGPWATPVINSVVLAIVLVRFRRVFLPNIGILSTVLMVLLSGAPFYTSAIMADIWIVTALLALMIASKEGSRLFGLIAVAAITMHGGHIYALSIPAVVLVVFSADRARALVRVATVMAVALCLVGSARLLGSMYGVRNLNWAMVTSHLLNDIPDLLPTYCARWPADNLCVGRGDIEAILRNGKDADDKIVWRSPVFDRDAPINFASLNGAGPRLLFLALTRFPSTLAVETYHDLWTATFDRCHGFLGWVKPVGHLAAIQEREPPITLAKSGFFSRTDVCAVLRSCRYALYGAAALALGYVLAFAAPGHRLVALAAIAAVTTNLLFYTTVAGGFGRYHLRALLLLGIVVLAAWNAFLQRHHGPT